MLLTNMPVEIFSLITHDFSLREVVRLCQVCKQFFDYVRRDKHLWLEQLRHKVLSKGIELPAYCRDLNDASSEDVYSWVKTSIVLQKAYFSGGRNASLVSTGFDKNLEATWTKIIRGRWCLAALSNPTTSFIGVWQILSESDGSLKLERKYYFPGPVLDGLVEDNSNEIHIAVTIGTSTPYIQILNFGMEEGAPGLRSIQILEGARQVLLLRGSIIGYKALHGDDTYPLLTYWPTGTTIRLYSSLFCLNPDIMVGDILSHCHAMCVWRDHLFAVFDYTIEAFRLPYLDESPPFIVGTQLLQFPYISTERLNSYWIVEAYFYELGQTPSGAFWKPSNQSLFISVRDRQGYQYTRAVSQTEDGSFTWDAELSKDFEFDVETQKHCNGTSSEYQLRLASGAGYSTDPVFLQLVRPNRSSVGDSNIDTCLWDRQTFVVSAPNLLNLELTTTLDFDDGAGVILLGNCRGQISVLQFVPSSSRNTSALYDDLPIMVCDLPELDTSPIATALPLCYHLHEQIHECSVPSCVREEVIDTWDKALGLPRIAPPPGWSNDWEKHTTFQNWVFPFCRWQTLAADRIVPYSRTWAREIQNRLGDAGDIIPILYKEENHDFVIFKIAFRVYYFLRGPPREPMDHLVCALPFTVEQLSNPDVLDHVWQNRWRRGRLCIGSGDVPKYHLASLAHGCLAVLEYLKTEEGQQELQRRSLTEDLRTWSLDDRWDMFRIAKQIYESTRKSMNAKQDVFGEY